MTRNPNQPSVPPAPSLPTPQHNAKRERGAREDAKRERGAKTGYGTRAEVDLAALRHNVATLRAQLAPGSRLIAVVKAGGYGHGARPSAAAALQAGAAALAVGRVSEGLALRAAGIDAPVLVLGYNTAAETEAAVQAGLALTPSCLDDVDAAARAAARLGRPAALHVKVDTGMRRLGLPPAEAAPVIALARTHPGLRLEGLYTHLACADDPDPAPSEQQFQRFRDFAAGVDPHHQLTWHVCNTAAARRFPHMHLDAVRVGIGLYGIDPRNVDPGNINTASYAPAVDLRPALTLRSTILRCFDLAPGESLGYGASFTATTPPPHRHRRLRLRRRTAPRALQPRRRPRARPALPHRGAHLHGPLHRRRLRRRPLRRRRRRLHRPPGRRRHLRRRGRRSGGHHQLRAVVPDQQPRASQLRQRNRSGRHHQPPR